MCGQDWLGLAEWRAYEALQRRWQQEAAEEALRARTVRDAVFVTPDNHEPGPRGWPASVTVSDEPFGVASPVVTVDTQPVAWLNSPMIDHDVVRLRRAAAVAQQRYKEETW